MSISEIDKNILKDALTILSRRDMSERELFSLLRKKKHDENNIRKVITYITEKRWYNETKSARSLAEGKMKRTGSGPLLIRKLLQDKSFPAQLIDVTLKTVYDLQTERIYAKKAMEKKLPSLNRKYDNDHFKKKMALKRFLAQKGFSFEICDEIANMIDDI